MTGPAAERPFQRSKAPSHKSWEGAFRRPYPRHLPGCPKASVLPTALHIAEAPFPAAAKCRIQFSQRRRPLCKYLAAPQSQAAPPGTHQEQPSQHPAAARGGTSANNVGCSSMLHSSQPKHSAVKHQRQKQRRLPVGATHLYLAQAPQTPPAYKQVQNSRRK